MTDLTVTLRLVGNADNMTATVVKSREEVKKLGETGKAAGSSIASGMASASAGAKGFTSFAQQAGQASLRLGQTAVAGGAQAAAGLRAAQTAANSFQKQLVSLRSDVAAILSVSLGVAAIRQINNLADGYTNLTSKIRNVTSSEAALSRVRERSYEIAQLTRSSFEGTANLYARITRATETLALSEMQRLRITESINKAYIVAGATYQEATNSIIQLTQGLAAGALRGEEFNSVAEQGPIILDILGKSLNKTRGELRAMAKQGELTSEVITTAILQNSSMIDKQFENIAVTVEGAAVRVSNAWQKWIGETSTAAGASAGVAAALTALANNFDFVASAVIGLIALMTTRYLSALTNAAYQAIVTSNANAAAALEAQNLATAELNAARAAEAEALALVNKTRAMVAAGAATGTAAVEEAAYAAAQIRTAEAVAASNVAMAAKVGIAARLGSGLLSLVGGPFGLAIIAITTLIALTYSWIKAEEERIKLFNEGIENLKKTTDATRDLHDAFNDLAEAPPSLAAGFTQLEDAMTVFKQKSEELIEAQQRLRDESDANDRSIARFGLELPGFAKAKQEVEDLTSELRLLQRAQEDLTNDLVQRFTPAADTLIAKLSTLKNSFNLGDVFSVVSSSISGFLDDVNKTIEADAKAKNFMVELRRSASSTSEALANHGKTAREVAQAMVDLGIEQLRTAGYSDQVIAKVQAEGQAYVEAAAKLESLNKKKKGPSADKEIEREQRRLQRAAEASREFTAETLALAAAMQGPLAQATTAYDVAFEELYQKWQNGQITAEQFSSRMEVLTATFDATSASIKEQQDVFGNLAAQTKYEQSLIRMTARQKVFAEAYHKASQEFKQNKAFYKEAGIGLEAFATAAANAAVSTYDVSTNTDRLNDALAEFGKEDPFTHLTNSAKLFEEALDKATDPERIKVLQRALDNVKEGIGKHIVGAAREGLQSLQSMTKEGSKSFQALQVLIDATTLAEAILAVVHQGTGGDVYTAIPRMIAVAAAVASLGVTIGNIANSGFSDTAAERQATQGTGSVLGDTTADSESIKNGVEITANATSTLVGINRGMLNALLSLQASLGSAANMLARGAGQADFSGFDLSAADHQSFWTGSIADPLGILGGSSKITDEGIIIFAGALNDLLNGIAVGAYQEVQSRSWLFGSTQTREGLVDVSDAFSTQFQLIVGSIIDTVKAGAEALGVVPEDIQAALDAFRVEEIRISLKGLTAEEQQAELAAVFSELFDGIAGAVVPFIDQFQQVGEGLGETLVRVATEVQVMREAIRYLGITVDETDPERFAQISDGLINLAGGIDAFISQMTSFASNFAPDAYKFGAASSSLTDALTQVGLAVPDTRDGMWELMQSLDATTEAGREQIATLLRLSDAADQYYQYLENQVADAQEYLASIGLANGMLSAFGQEILKIRAAGDKAADAANVLAIAHGREGASALELSRIRQWTLSQEAAAIRKLMQQTQDLIAQLYGGIPGSLDAIEAEIARLEGLGGGISSSFDNASSAVEDFFSQWESGIESLNDYLDQMLFGDLSALTPEQQLQEMWQQFTATQQAALGGDVNALNSLPQMAQALLQMIREQDASGNDYNSQFFQIREMLQAVAGVANPFSPVSNGGGGGSVQVVPSDELRALYEARDALLLEQEDEYRRNLAQQLAQNLSDLAVLLNTPVLELIQLQGISLTALAEDLGVDLENLTASSVQALGDMAVTLGTTLTDLTGALGLQLTDLSTGLTELTQRLGIDLSNLTVSSVESLGTLAASLGADLSDLAVSLGLDLGELADTQSLLNQALHDQLTQLPTEQADALTPLLEAVEQATTEADANAALEVLNNAVNELAPDIRNLLAPYLEGVFPAQALSQLDYLSDLQSIAADSLDELSAIRSNLRQQNTANGIPSYAVGTGYIPSTGMAYLHQGEAVVPAHVNAWLRQNGFPTASNDRQVDNSGLREEVIRLREAVERAGERTVTTIVHTSEKSDRSNAYEMERQTTKLAGSAGRSSKF